MITIVDYKNIQSKSSFLLLAGRMLRQLLGRLEADVGVLGEAYVDIG